MSSGRGPTRLISPRSTFHSSGSSSRLVARRNAPRRVTRAASLSNQTSPRRGDRIVRNFQMRIGLPRSPGRTWRKKIGRPMVAAIATAVQAMTGPSRTMPVRAPATSIPRLTASPTRRPASSIPTEPAARGGSRGETAPRVEDERERVAPWKTARLDARSDRSHLRSVIWPLRVSGRRGVPGEVDHLARPYRCTRAVGSRPSASQ
jgi:hypothetical protein